MRFNRQSIRKKGYDYSLSGYYFITICIYRNESLLGEVINQEMVLSSAGEMIEKWFNELENKYNFIQCDEIIIMPNHIHFILKIKTQVQFKTIGDIMKWFKTMTTNEYIRKVKHENWPPFSGKLWHRNYYECIIRNEIELKNTRKYIQSNPKNWKT